MQTKRRVRGVPQEPVFEISLGADFALDDPDLRLRSFVGWCRKHLGIGACRSVTDVLEVRRTRAELSSRQRELIAKIDDALVLAELIYPNRTARELRATGMRLQRGSDGKRIKNDEQILDLVVGHLDQALWLERQRLKQRELRAPIRVEGSPLRVDLDLITAVHKATLLPFAEVVRRVYEHIDNTHGRRDTFVASEIRALQKARQRRRA